MNRIDYNLRDLDLTQASRFILPMLYKEDQNDFFFITENFNNCFIGDAHHPEIGQGIFILYDYQMTINYVKFERKLELLSEFKTDYDYGDERQTMYVFNIPDAHLKDFSLFLEGRYTKISPSLKSKILKFWDMKSDMNHLIYSVLHGTNYIKSYWSHKNFDYKLISAPGEYWAKPLLEKEIFYNPHFDK